MLPVHNMTELLGLLAVGVLAGWIVGEMRKGEGFGLLGNAAVGMFGAIIGGILFRYFHVSEYFNLSVPFMVETLFSSLVGALALLFVFDQLGLKT